MSHAQRKQIRKQIADFCRTATAPEAAERFRCGRTTIEKACREHGVRCRMAHKLRHQ